MVVHDYSGLLSLVDINLWWSMIMVEYCSQLTIVVGGQLPWWSIVVVVYCYWWSMIGVDHHKVGK